LSILNAWMSGVNSLVETAPSVRAADKRGAACSKSTAFPAPDFPTEQINVINDALKQYMQHNSTGGAEVQAQGVAVYLRCFSPAVNAFYRILAARGKEFMARYAVTIRRLQATLARQVSAITAKYDVPLVPASGRKRG
jgi:hypothetical protein